MLCPSIACTALLAVIALPAVPSRAAEDISLRNERTAICFARSEGGLYLSELRCLRPERSFLAADTHGGPLWRLTLRPPTYAADAEVSLDSTAPCRTEAHLSHVGQTQQATLLWAGIDLPGESAALDVTVTVDLPPGEALSEWRIAVANRSEKLGLWTVDFPVLPSLHVSQRGVLAVPLGWGTLRQDPLRTGDYTANYPGLFATLQLTSLSDRGACLYVGSHDPDGYVKQINWKTRAGAGCLEYFLRGYPEDMGRPGKDYQSPYPVAIGCLPGDWFDAAKRYREWVVSEAPWAPKEPLEHYTGSPEWLKGNALWMQSNGGGTTEPTDHLLECISVKQAMPDVPMADQLYWWQRNWPDQTQFDEGYPDTFFSLGRGEVEIEALRKVREAGVRMVPYTNPNLVDARTDYWKEGGWRFAALPAEQAGRHDRWIADLNADAEEGKPVNVTMCPFSPERQEIVIQWARKIVGEFDFDGVYLDQVACVDATRCFDPSHGHPLGGGKHWVQGYRQMLSRVQQAIREINPEAILTTESACEPFGVFDAYLRCNEAQAWMTPIWSAVYGGLYHSYGSYLYGEDEFGGCLYAGKLAQLFTYGAQLGWLGVSPRVREPSAWMAYLHELCRARTAAVRWMGLGEYLRPPQIAGAGEVTGRWKLFAAEYDVTWPAVLGSAFRAADGTVALAFTNFSGEEQAVQWRSRLSDLGLRRPCEVTALYPADSDISSVRRQGLHLTGTLTMPALSARVLVVEG